MTSLCEGEAAALSVEDWFLRRGLDEGGLFEQTLTLVVLSTVVMLAGLRVVLVTEGEVGIKPA